MRSFSSGRIRGKYSQASWTGRMPPSREREIWTLVSFVKREKVAVRRGRDVMLLYWMYAQKLHEKEGEGKALRFR